MKRIIVCFLLILTMFLFAFPIFAQSSSLEDLSPDILEIHEDLLQFFDEDYSEAISDFETIDDLDEFQSFLSTTNTRWKSRFSRLEGDLNGLAVNANGDSLIVLNAYFTVMSELELATSAYSRAATTSDQTVFDRKIEEGDQYMSQALDSFNLAADIYNEKSGATSTIETMWFLGIATVISFFLVIWFQFLSISSSARESAKLRSQVFSGLRNNSLAMFIGFGITWGGLYLAVNSDSSESGSYYVFYGPVLFGFWGLLSGSWFYLTKGRKILKEQALLERNDMLSQAFSHDEGNGESNKTTETAQRKEGVSGLDFSRSSKEESAQDYVLNELEKNKHD